MRHPFAFLVSLILGGLLIATPARADTRDTPRADEPPAVVLPGSIASIGLFVARTMIAQAVNDQRHAVATPVEPPSLLLKRLLPWLDHSSKSARSAWKPRPNDTESSTSSWSGQ